MQDVSRLTQRVQQVANGWESRLWIVTDELLEFEALIPVIHEFDALESGVSLRITQEVLKGVWEALREGRADLIIGTINEPPAIPSLRWMQLGEMEWVFAVSPRHPLAKAQEPISRAMVAQHRAIVVAIMTAAPWAGGWKNSSNRTCLPNWFRAVTGLFEFSWQ
jgi:DNA-binding transcriptional LysR family regulator